MKKTAIYESFDSHACEAWFRCPECNKIFGSWAVFGQLDNENGTNKYCPHCKVELDGLD